MAQNVRIRAYCAILSTVRGAVSTPTLSKIPVPSVGYAVSDKKQIGFVAHSATGE